MRIQHNIMAMNAYRNYNTNTSALSKNLEKLSSGYKINRAGDDAAGLAISEKMRAQITGLNAAQKNVKDGISLVKTAEGAMQEIQDMLNRMDYLATQSANGTYDNEVDRYNLQKEVDQLKSEINRIADSANFNGIKLLDGSLDETVTDKTDAMKAATSELAAAQEELANAAKAGDNVAVYKEYSDTQIKALLPGNGAIAGPNDDPLDTTVTGKAAGSQTYLQIGGISQQSPKFSIDLTGLKHKIDGSTTGDDNKFSLNVKGSTGAAVQVKNADGDTLVNVTGGAAGAVKSDADLARLFDGGSVSIDGINYTVKADGAVLNFTTTDTPTKAIDTNLDVFVTQGKDATANPKAEAATTNGTLKTSVKVNWADSTAAATGGTSGLGSITNVNATDTTYALGNLEDYINDNQLGIGSGTSALAVSFGKISAAGKPQDGKLGLYVGNELVGVAVDGTNAMQAFAATDGNGTAVNYTFKALKDDAVVAGTDLGTLTVKDDAGGAIAAGTFDAQVASAATVTPGVNATTLKSVTFADADAAKIGAAAAAATGTADGDAITIQKDAAGKLALYSGTVKISADADFAAGTAVEFKDTDGNVLLKATFEAGTTAANITQGAAGKLDTGLTYKAATTNATGDPATNTDNTTGIINVGTTKIDPGIPSGNARPANTTLKLDDLVKDGGMLTLGDKTYVFAVGADSAYKDYSADNTEVIDLTKYAATDTDLKKAAGNALSKKENDTFSIGHSATAGTITLQQKDTTNDDMTTLDKLLGFIGYKTVDATATSTAKAAAVKEATDTANAKITAANEKLAAAEEEMDGKALTLQIGDTSDKFNQMQVKVGDMHVDAMGIMKTDEKGAPNGVEVKDGKAQSIKEINISTIDGAHAAIDVIKNAINYVSGIRGDLGATQNRLEHTANNLSVMAENIQDAESTIRDTDVAEEMMAYTKNNILVQSAQAMLAQANAVPQGVLQLLG